MTRAIAILIFVFSVFSLQAQTNDIDKKLLAKYSKKELSTLKAENPDEYKFAKYCIDNAFYIANSSKEKNATIPNGYKTIKLKDVTNTNFFELNIELKQNDHQAFTIKGTSKLLIVKSRNHILTN